MTFHCVHCMAPSESTYRQFSREIKLTTCDRCGQNVDPYVERDWLLVAMDCILLRDEAYRHVLSNRGNITPTTTTTIPIEKSAKEDAPIKKYMFLHSWQSFWIVSSAIQAYLLLQEEQLLMRRQQQQTGGTNNSPSLMFLSLLLQSTTNYNDERGRQGDYNYNNDERRPSLEWWIPVLLFYSLVGNFVFLMGLQWGFRLFLLKRDDNNTTSNQHKQQQLKQLQSRLTLAILLPTSFHGIAIFVMIWENTTMVRCLASVLVLYYQYLAATVAMQLQLASTTTITTKTTDATQPRASNKKTPSRISFWLVFAVGLIVRSIVLSLLRGAVQSLDNRNNTNVHIPCILGLDTSVLGDMIGVDIPYAVSICLG